MLDLLVKILEAEIHAQRSRVLFDQPARLRPLLRRVGTQQPDGGGHAASFRPVPALRVRMRCMSGPIRRYEHPRAKPSSAVSGVVAPLRSRCVMPYTVIGI